MGHFAEVCLPHRHSTKEIKVQKCCLHYESTYTFCSSFINCCESLQLQKNPSVKTAAVHMRTAREALRQCFRLALISFASSRSPYFSTVVSFRPSHGNCSAAFYLVSVALISNQFTSLIQITPRGTLKWQHPAKTLHRTYRWGDRL